MCRCTMAHEIHSVDDVEPGDIISANGGRTRFEVVDVQPEPDGFGPPGEIEARVLDDDASSPEHWGHEEGGTETIGKGDLHSWEVVDE